MSGQSIEEFTECLRVGKEQESAVSLVLCNNNFDVTDISDEKIGNRYSPFDLVFSEHESKFIADIKLRGGYKDLWFTVYDLEAWVTYKTSALKLIIFAGGFGLPYRFVTVEEAARSAFSRGKRTLHLDYKVTFDLVLLKKMYSKNIIINPLH